MTCTCKKNLAGMIWYVLVWLGMVVYGSVWFGMDSYGLVCLGVWRDNQQRPHHYVSTRPRKCFGWRFTYGVLTGSFYGMVWYGMVWYGMVWYGW